MFCGELFAKDESSKLKDFSKQHQAWDQTQMQFVFQEEIISL